MRKFISYLEKNELDYIKDEYTTRAKLSKWASNNNRTHNNEKQDENLYISQGSKGIRQWPINRCNS